MLVFTGFMIALSVVLSKLVSINISFLRIGFGFLPVAVLAIMYGPYVAAIGYGLPGIYRIGSAHRPDLRLGPI